MAKEKKHKKKYDFSSADLLRFTWRKRIPLAVITGVAIVFSAIASLMITPLYKSEVVLFPATGTSVSQILTSDNYSGRYEIYETGDEEQAEKLLQVLNSNEIRDRIISKHNLAEHYGFRQKSKHLKSKLHREYKSNIRFKRTPYMSVLIEVMDKDPVVAANIAGDIADLTDTVFHRIIGQRALEAFNLVEKEYQESAEALKMLEDSLAFYSQLGINDYETQAERYHEAYGKAILEGNYHATRVLEGKLKVLSQYGTQYLSARTRVALETNRLYQLKRRYSEAKLEADHGIPYKFVVDKAEIPDKKSYPRRSVIVLISALSAFLLGLIAFIVEDSIRKRV